MKSMAQTVAKAEKEECLAVLRDPALVLVNTGRLNPPPATVNERADFLRGEKGIDAAIVKAALDECGMKEIEYERDYFGRIIYPNFPV